MPRLARLLCLAPLLFGGCDPAPSDLDAGSSEVDGGRDAGAEIDAGPIAEDAGPIAEDTGPIAEDAGPIDAGPDPCSPNPCRNGGRCDRSGSQSYYCSCDPDWTGPTCEQCGVPCSSRPNYYRDRFLDCYRDTDFCDRPTQSCEEFCEGWMGCTGALQINSDGVGTVTGPPGSCF